MLTKLIGAILKQPFIYTWLWKLARRTPDLHIPSPDGSEIYMYRYWLFNKIDANHQRKYEWIPFSIRIHHIVQPDLDRHLHDHPFNARTWIMRGGYTEVRREEVINRNPDNTGLLNIPPGNWNDPTDPRHWHLQYHRGAGESTTLGFEQYHKITELDPGGALTFFAFGRYQGAWGFMVDGVKVLHRAYEKTADCEFLKDANATLRYDGGHEDKLSAHAPAGICLAMQQSDQMVCDKCMEAWDVNDLEPPICSNTGKPARASGGPTLFTSGLQNVDHTNEIVRLQNEANMNAWNEAQRLQQTLAAQNAYDASRDGAPDVRLPHRDHYGALPSLTIDEPDEFDDPLPEWAIGTADGKLVLGAQLPTRDGRRMGNAHIISEKTKCYAGQGVTLHLYLILTDAGNTLVMTDSEVRGAFYDPVYISEVSDVIEKFWREDKSPLAYFEQDAQEKEDARHIQPTSPWAKGK